MKKHILTFAALLALTGILGACTESSTDRSDALISGIMSEAAAAQTAISAVPAGSDPISVPQSSVPSDTAETTAAADPSHVEEPVAIDLTQMTPTMVYSVIYDIMVNTDRYYGRTILLDGFFDTDLDEKYYFVVVPDATACCSQGLEFKLGDTKVYPDDYPEKSADIRLRGTLEKYEEEGQSYCYIKADWVKVL